MAKLESRLAALEALIIARSRGKQVGIWFDVETETEEQAIARARKEGHLKENDEPLLMRWYTQEEASDFEQKLRGIPGAPVPPEEERPECYVIGGEPLGAAAPPQHDPPGLDFIRHRLKLDYPDWGCV
jgi:hypothetical protein